jgi:hypothetical protein
LLASGAIKVVKVVKGFGLKMTEDLSGRSILAKLRAGCFEWHAF